MRSPSPLGKESVPSSPLRRLKKERAVRTRSAITLSPERLIHLETALFLGNKIERQRLFLLHTAGHNRTDSVDDGYNRWT